MAAFLVGGGGKVRGGKRKEKEGEQEVEKEVEKGDGEIG